MSDCEWMLTELKKGRVLTSWICITERGCTRAASRINDLRRRGHTIKTTMKTGIDRDGHPVRFAEYRLIEGGNT